MQPGDRRIHIVILRAGNGAGKSALSANMAAYLSSQYPNEYFDRVPVLKNYRRPNRGRIITTANAALTVYDEELAKWLPRKGYDVARNGYKFNQHYKMKATGSEFDLFTFDRDAAQAESTTLDWAIVDEPLPRRMWSALKSRFRFGGIIFMHFTALEGSGWYKHVFEVDERLGVDVHVMELSAEEACIQHGVRGILDHATLESMWADFDEAELPARKDGKYMSAAGLIYPTYRDQNWTDQNGKIVAHVIHELEGYHQRCYDEGLFNLYCILDPADRKPFAFGWKLVFPNLDRITIAEWPDESMRMFHKIKSCAWDINMYAKMIRATEEGIAGRPADVRIIDPNFGNAIKATSKSTVIEEFRANGKEIGWSLDFDDSVNDKIDEGHIAVRSALGDPARGIRPKSFTMAHCKNHRFGLRNYAFKEERDERKGLGERPELQYKDFPDLDRYFEMHGPRYREIIVRGSPEHQAMIARRQERYQPKRAAGYVGMF